MARAGNREPECQPGTVDVSAGLVESSYVASQRTAMQRAGRIYLHQDGEGIWVGGEVVDVIEGTIQL